MTNAGAVGGRRFAKGQAHGVQHVGVRAATVGVMQETSFVGSRRKARESEQPGLTE